MKSLSLLVVVFLLASQASAYSPSLALHLGYYAAASYDTPSAISSWTCSYCQRYPLADPKVFLVGSIQGFVGYSKSLNAIVVIFRGSANFQNWLTNLNTVRTSYPACGGCSVHSGFYSGYNSVSSTVKNDVNNLKAKYRDAKLIIAGHSLGGALAILAAADLVNLHAIDATYTFGQPRIGNDAFAAWYPTRVHNTFRVIHYADIVPHVPPASFGFVHSSTQLWYQRDMQTYSTCAAQSNSCANSIATTSFSTDDHNLDQYLKLRTITDKKSELEYVKSIYSSLLLKNKIKNQKETQIWQAEQLRKVSEILKQFSDKSTPKNIRQQ